MPATFNGVTETATGVLLRCGYCDFLNDGNFDAAKETYHTDVPRTAYMKEDPDSNGDHHEHNGSAWVLTSPTLAENKVTRKKEINQRTRELLKAGIDVGGGDILSASPKAQANMERQHRSRANATIVTYPLKFPFRDDSGSHSIAGAPALDTLYDTYMAAVQTVVKGGYDLKDDIEDAVDQAALDAVVDSR